MGRKIFEIIIDEDITPPGVDELMGLNPYSRVTVKFKHGGELYRGETVINTAFLSAKEELKVAFKVLGSALHRYRELEK